MLLVLLLGLVAIPAPTVNANPQAPAQSGLPGDLSYMATGDSFSAGEGIPGQGDCAQNNKAYGPRVRDGLGASVDKFAFTACTGRLAEDLLNNNPKLPQTYGLWDWGVTEQHLGEPVDLVTMSFGGNDIGFAELVLDCIILPDSWGDALAGATIGLAAGGGIGWGVAGALLSDVGEGCGISAQALQSRIDTLQDANPQDGCKGGRVPERYLKGENFSCSLLIKDAASPSQQIRGDLADLYEHIVDNNLTERGHLVVVGYPSLFAPESEWPGILHIECAGITKGDWAKLADKNRALNTAIKNAVDHANEAYTEHRVHFVDIYPAYRDGKRDLCGTNGDWINGLTLKKGKSLAAPHSGSFHPNEFGHAKTAELVEAKVRSLDWRGQARRKTGPTTGSGDVATSLVFDVSDSMSESAGTRASERKIDAAIRVGHDVVGLFDIQAKASRNAVVTTAGVVTFSSGSSELLAPTSDVGELNSAIDSLSPTGGTDLGSGLQAGLTQLQGLGQSGAIVLLSDGVSNEGLGRDEILGELVPQVNAARITVHTVGFGEPGALDEDLLRQIASATGGEYYYAATPTALRQAFLTSQAATVGDVQHSVLGAAAQGELADAGTFPVPAGVGTLEATLAWPGSDLDVQLRDPDGTLVDDDYQGATFHRTNPEVVVVDNPKGGDWQFGVLGVDVPGTTEEFAAVASTRGTATADVEEEPEEAAPAPAAARDDSGGMSGVTVGLLIALGLLAVVAAGAIGGLVVSRRRARMRCGTCGATVEVDLAECPRCRGPVVPILRFRAIDGPQAGRTFDVRPGHRLGRAEDVEHAIDDPSVSRQHAQVVWTQEGWAVVDLGSTAGTLRNGAAVERARLSPGDVVTLGDTVLVVEQAPVGAALRGRSRG